MSEIYSNKSLKHLNSFGLPVTAARFFEPVSIEELENFFKNIYRGEAFLLLGEGSNTLFIANYDGLVIHPLIKGIRVLEENDQTVVVEAGAGENWDQFVQYTVQNNWFGAENLSLIPGSVGSVPVQNIGAYGTEAKDIIKEVRVFDTKSLHSKVLGGEECDFGYRQSVFKSELGKNMIVTSVVFRLSKSEIFNLEYGDIRRRFEELEEKNIQNLREIIISIRREKLPDPAETGNAGSFFKNPVISGDEFARLKVSWPDIPGYILSENMVKVPAAWLIQQTGWKGYREGDAGCWQNQPLVLVNYGNASGKQILSLSEKIAESIRKNFGIELEREVKVV